MTKSKTLLKLTGAAGFLLALAALVVVVSPAVRGQVVRERPPVQIRTLVQGGSALGIQFREVDEADVRREQLPQAAGAVVVEVESDSPAAEAGFRAGDVVVTFDGERVRSARQLARLIDDTPAGREITAAVMRAGERVELSVTPEERGATAFFPSSREWRDFSVEVPRSLEELRLELPRSLERFRDRETPIVLSRTRARLGVTVDELTGQLADYFGAPAGGVLVASVTEDTPASRAGLQAGDVITGVAGQPVHSAGDLQRRLRELSGEVELSIVRDRQARTIAVTLDAGEQVRRPSAGTAIRK